MAITHHYCDPSIAADSGTGTVGDPFGDLEYLFETATPGANGNQVNVKAGTAEVLAANLQTAITAGTFTSSITNPLIIKGYTSAADDGGIGEISGGGSVTIYDGTLTCMQFADLHIHSAGATNLLKNTGLYISIHNVEFDNTTSNGVWLGTSSSVVDCYLHNIGGIGVFTQGGYVANNIFANGTNTFTWAIRQSGAGTFYVGNNILDLSGSSIGISGHSGVCIVNNSVYGGNGTGQGIDMQATQRAHIIANNIVEGFSGTGGNGFDMGTVANASIAVYGGNSAYNNTTEYTAPAIEPLYLLGGAASNETLSASPFTDPTGNDFSPVDTGSVKEGSLPNTFPSI
jgi:hypothetical protein